MKPSESDFTLNHFLRQMQQINRLGSMQSIMRTIPGMNEFEMPDPEYDLKRIEGIVRSMTQDERNRPGIIDHGRRRRIAKGSGNQIRDVIRLLRDFEKMRQMMTAFPGMGFRDRMRNLPETRRDSEDNDRPDRNSPRTQ